MLFRNSGETTTEASSAHGAVGPESDRERVTGAHVLKTGAQRTAVTCGGGSVAGVASVVHRERIATRLDVQISHFKRYFETPVGADRPGVVAGAGVRACGVVRARNVERERLRVFAGEADINGEFVEGFVDGGC